MRYGLVSTVAVAALSLSVAAGFAQSSGSSSSSTGTSTGTSTGSSGSVGGTTGGSAGTSTESGTSSAPAVRPPQSGTNAQGSTSGTTNQGTAQGTTRQDQTTTGSTSTNINISSEQRTTLVRSFSSVRAEPLTNVNFNVAVGTVVPTTVTTLETCPADVVRIVNGLPECRYIVVRDKIVLIEPSSRRIVLVLDRPS